MGASTPTASGAQAASVADKFFQVSFASQDSLAVMKFRDAIEKVPGWKPQELLNNAVADKGWLPRWGGQTDEASGVVVVCTDTYRAKLRADPNTACLKEAALIKLRLERDPSFIVYALDPAVPGQDANAIRTLLLDKETSMNLDGWMKLVAECSGKTSDDGKTKIAGSWVIFEKRAGEFHYEFNLEANGSFSGGGKSARGGEGTNLVGTLNGSVLTWEEFSQDNGEKLADFEAQLSGDFQTMTGLGSMADSSVNFNFTGSQAAPSAAAAAGHHK